MSNHAKNESVREYHMWLIMHITKSSQTFIDLGVLGLMPSEEIVNIGAVIIAYVINRPLLNCL